MMHEGEGAWLEPNSKTKPLGPVSVNKREEEGHSRVEGTYLWWGQLGWRSRDVGIDWCARVGVFGGRTKDRATMARFWLTQHREAHSWVVGTHLGQGRPGLRG